MYAPRIRQRPADVYTVRIFDPRSRPRLLRELKDAVSSCGGKFIAELVENRGFIFSLPPNTPNPWTNYQHGKLLEEGCIHVTKVEREADSTDNRQRYEQCESVKSSDDEEDSVSMEENVDDHPKLKMQWTWTELKK
ncbi:hypothetical protein GQ44DRAFT_768834 [Phaeosphaeriaceae sp. PMI808]|nr:hypothetical protein GQ44DRAFT_768834 [Phaeosphaeriaceae sp. PMI808]